MGRLPSGAPIIGVIEDHWCARPRRPRPPSGDRATPHTPAITRTGLLRSDKDFRGSVVLAGSQSINFLTLIGCPPFLPIPSADLRS